MSRTARIFVMDIDSLRNYCLSFPHATEDIQWGNDLLFRISGKIFAVMSLEPPHSFAFKCSPEKFDQLIEIEDVVPAPYMARNKWVMMKRLDAIADRELKALIRNSYDMILAKLPKKTQVELDAVKHAARTPRRAKKK